jgi:hypothetical protein
MLSGLGDGAARRSRCRPLIEIAAVRTGSTVSGFASLARGHCAVARQPYPNISVPGSHLDAVLDVYYIA